MRKLILLLISAQISIYQYGQIIADHTVVERFDDIPQEYINKVKEMWLVYAGESHSKGIRVGLQELETAYPAYSVSIIESGTPEAFTNTNLRASRATWGNLTNSSGWIYSYGEEDWFTSSTAISRTKAGINYCNTNNLIISAMGFGWCWDPAIIDMTDYLNATQEYIDYCTLNRYSTKVLFTTGPVDGENATGEVGYNKYLAHESIRGYVNANSSRILFDYADILCYNDGSMTPNTSTWDGHTYPIITNSNYLPTAPSYHISVAGTLRLAKAMWWMLARIAGWDGKTSVGVQNFGDNNGSIKKRLSSDRIEIELGEEFLTWQAGLYNFQGMSILTSPVENNVLTFNISKLHSGIYFVVLSNGEKRFTEKFIKP